MSLLLPPPTPGSNSRDYNEDDADSDVSEDSAGLFQCFPLKYVANSFNICGELSLLHA